MNEFYEIQELPLEWLRFTQSNSQGFKLRYVLVHYVPYMTSQSFLLNQTTKNFIFSRFWICRIILFANPHCLRDQAGNYWFLMLLFKKPVCAIKINNFLIGLARNAIWVKGLRGNSKSSIVWSLVCILNCYCCITYVWSTILG